MVVAAEVGLSDGRVRENRRPWPYEDASVPRKRFKGGDAVGDMKKVAGMVLVLAAMGKMRGGRAPTEAEKEMMAEARNGLVRICEGFTPKEVFGRDGFAGVVKDLGLNGLEERSGVQPRKISIAQKLLDSKRKMEQADDFSFSFTPLSSQRHQGNYGALQNLQTSKMGSSASLSYQLPISEIKPGVSRVFQPNRSVSVAPCGSDRPNLRSEGRSKELSHASLAQANNSVNPSVRTPTCSMQPQPISSGKIGSDNKVLGTAQVTSRTTHADIACVAQELLQPRVSARRIWIPPSREYMNKAVTCQICMGTVTEIHSILICDACDNGYHLKCLQSTHLKAATSGDWHCGKCLSSSNGKPFPPKYGLVMRNMNMLELSSTSTAVPSTSTKQVGASEEKFGHPMVTINGKTKIQNVPIEAEGDNDIISSGGVTDDKVYHGKWPNRGDKRYDEEMVPVLLNAHHGNSTMVNGEANTVKKSLKNHNRDTDSKESPSNKCLSHTSTMLRERNVGQNSSSDIVSNSGSFDQDGSSDCLHATKWVGNPVRVLEEKTYYASCSINGHVYKVMDHVVIRVDNAKLTPAKLQAMWEDIHTMKKWVTVNRCYFPNDLPEGVGHPCSSSSDEVYESTCSITLMADLIESPCKVLPAGKFAEETQNRSFSVAGSTPLFLCRWIYDESKGLFRDVSC